MKRNFPFSGRQMHRERTKVARGSLDITEFQIIHNKELHM